jgi:glycosyltransferase involved in cell wall biosynthesis
MRILHVNHQYPPFSCQGSELHCQQLVQALSASGDVVAVFHISNTSPRLPRRLERRVDAGISLFHCIDGMEYSRVADWPNSFLQQSFRSTLAEFRPDVVHFHNYLSLGDDLVGLARIAGAAVVYTLHDYGLICPNSLLLLNDGAICRKGSADFFRDCCPESIRVSGGRRPAIRSHLPALIRWQRFADHQRRGVTREVLKRLVAFAKLLLGEPVTTAVPEKKAFYLEATDRIFRQLQLVIAPSAYLRDRFISCGLDSGKVVHERYGLPHFPRYTHRPSPDGKLRFGYIGAFHAHKGVQLLLEAFQGLGNQASLHIHGSSFGSPISEAHFRQITSGPTTGIVVHGRYDNEKLGEILAGIDVIVVPSLWVENSPLTIQEAQIAGVPVITANVGGMAELVRDGIDGLHFKIGDPVDLRRVLERVIDSPELLDSLRHHAPSVPTIEQQTQKMRQHYRWAYSRARELQRS